ncbi:MAG: carbohydrate ABC transporter permease [Treponema sp.]|nr:carbohydrate ABC transporter permease [Treponema sp.]
MAKIKKTKMKDTLDDKIYYVFVYSFLTLLTIVVLYPLIYVVSASFSDGQALLQGRVFLWPVGFSLSGYELVFSYHFIRIGYVNSFIYTISATALSVFWTMVAGYVFARRNLPFKGFFMFLFTFTMFFGGGMIPNFLLMRNLGLLNTRMVMIIPGLISVYNMIIARTFIQSSIPHELLEASQIDGCSNTRYFFQIILPLSKAVMAVLVLWYGVGNWNSYFGALLYLTDRNLYPLQLFLRQILIMNTVSFQDFTDPDLFEQMRGTMELLRFAVIVVGSLPVIVLYPFIQKYFAQGVMIGSIKG